MIREVEINDFLELNAKGFPTIDARSEAEYAAGHIPGSHNIPLLNDVHRAAVGRTYKQEGREAAVELGFKLVGPLFFEKFKAIQQKAGEGKKLLIYCWRGGMRSNILAWMMHLADYEVYLLKGGYKAFRNWALKYFEVPQPFIVLGGMTGAGKTEILHILKTRGEHVLDLEHLASHRGSAFGHIDMPPQPTNEHFENLIAIQLFRYQNFRPIWVENESRKIGRLKIPDALFNRLLKAPTVVLEVPDSIRKQRILEEYGKYDPEALAEATRKLQKRLGNERMNSALNSLYEKDLNKWLDEVLPYYDKTYQYDLEQRNSPVLFVPFDWNNVEESISNLLQLSTKLWKND
ncbi:tRNA 2-selenouridine synthase [Thermaurantimonas aggregans]|uniref:tRNA 2-selenouridine synthase n=1 Tax=Thermaurantimonas aggregans TaxID=2173829 RepID=A0A401XNH4_9FLAO|nr:tRNA 2-selenouridine(34) synthase MnmH [Thermaurantimonas aggregans]MCX8149816.1 tRNA 2-selenouridine(34) synthase MnmH [Thermaurantimonas aggregans]GCD78567.1 tRNA 2-selenouridine synthase [Thermaurantimonas aggregans]